MLRAVHYCNDFLLHKLKDSSSSSPLTIVNLPAQAGKTLEPFEVHCCRYGQFHACVYEKETTKETKVLYSKYWKFAIMRGLKEEI